MSEITREAIGTNRSTTSFDQNESSKPPNENIPEWAKQMRESRLTPLEIEQLRESKRSMAKEIRKICEESESKKRETGK